VSRQSIYDIEAGDQNVAPDQYENLIRACGISPEQWVKGFDERATLKLPRRHQGLVQLLVSIIKSGDDELIATARNVLDALSDKASPKEPSEKKATRASPGPS